MSQNKVGRSANAERPIEIELLFGLVDRIRITSDHQFLVGRDYPNLRLAAVDRKQCLLAAHPFILGRIEFDAKADHCVNSTHNRRIGAYVFLDLVVEHMTGEGSALIAFIHCTNNISSITGNTRDTQQTRFFVEDRIDFLVVQVFFADR